MGNEVEIRITGRDDSGAAFKSAQRNADQLSGGLRNLSAMFGDLVRNMANAAGAAVTAGINFAGSSVGVQALITALVTVAAVSAAAMLALFALAPAVLLVGGTFGAAATAGVGLAATIGTLVLGFGGLGDAWTAYGQQSARGGSSAASAARQVKSATDALADAQRAALRAQEDVTRARLAEQERLEDLNMSMAEAATSEKDAVNGVRRAREALAAARRGGSALDRSEAAVGLERAEQTLARVRERIQDLKTERADADRKGVEGSDQVQAALERQRLAQRQVADATARLADAHRGAGGGVDKFAEAMNNLSANGQALIKMLIGLKPRFDDLKKSVQDRLLSGLDTTLKNLVTATFPQLKTSLGGLADSANIFLKNIASGLSKPKFLTDFGIATAGFSSFMERLGRATEKMIGAIGTLAAKSLPFFDKLGELIEGTLTNFAEWIDEADRSGKLDQFMQDAAEALEDIWVTGGLVKDIIGELIEIFFPSSKDESDSVFASLKDTLTNIRDWLADPENQQKIRDWIEDMKTFGGSVAKLAGAFQMFIEWVLYAMALVDGFGDTIRRLKSRIDKASAGLFDGIRNAFKVAMNWVIDHWNDLELRLPSISMFGSTIGGGSLRMPSIERFASGGIAGGLAQVAERGRELISTPDGGMLLALPQGSMVHPNGATESMLAGGGGGDVKVWVGVRTDAETKVMRLVRELVDIYGDGDVQKAFGRNRSS